MDLGLRATDRVGKPGNTDKWTNISIGFAMDLLTIRNI